MAFPLHNQYQMLSEFVGRDVLLRSEVDRVSFCFHGSGLVGLHSELTTQRQETPQKEL